MNAPDTAAMAAPAQDQVLSVLALERGVFRVANGLEDERRWYVQIPVSADQYRQLRSTAADSTVSCEVVDATREHSAWVLEYRSPSVWHVVVVLLAGPAVSQMLAELPSTAFHVMYVAPDDRVVDLLVPTPQPLLAALAARHTLEIDAQSLVLGLMKLAAEILFPDGCDSVDNRNPQPRAWLALSSDMSALVPEGLPALLERIGDSSPDAGALRP